MDALELIVTQTFIGNGNRPFRKSIHTFDVPFKGYNVSSEVAEQSLSIALKQVVEYALEKKKQLLMKI